MSNASKLKRGKPSAAEKEAIATYFAIAGGLNRVLGVDAEPWLEGYANKLPSWAYKVLDKLKKTIFRTTLDETGPVTNPWHRLGRFVGLLSRVRSFGKHEAEGVLVQEGIAASDYERFIVKAITHEPGALKTLTKNNRHLKGKAAKSVRGTIRKVAVAVTAYQSQQIESGLGLALAQKPEDVTAFSKGFQTGFVMLLDETGQFSGGRDRTEFYLDLIVYWQEIERMRRQKPPLSRKGLFAYLQKRLHSIKVRDEEWLNDVCDEIGLSMKYRGRPAKKAAMSKLPVS